jgi:hypothetical protein
MRHRGTQSKQAADLDRLGYQGSSSRETTHPLKLCWDQP